MPSTKEIVNQLARLAVVLIKASGKLLKMRSMRLLFGAQDSQRTGELTENLPSCLLFLDETVLYKGTEKENVRQNFNRQVIHLKLFSSYLPFGSHLLLVCFPVSRYLFIKVSGKLLEIRKTSDFQAGREGGGRSRHPYLSRSPLCTLCLPLACLTIARPPSRYQASYS